MNRIEFLDFMRIYAFLSVLVGHKLFGQLQGLANDSTLHLTVRCIAQAIMPLCISGGGGLIVFFFISGYIITHVLQKEATVEFLIKRLFRIYPVYIFAVMGEILLGAIINSNGLPALSTLVPRLLLLGDFFCTPYSLGGVEWSLRVEVIFYLFMAILKGAGLFKRLEWLPVIFIFTTIILYMKGPFFWGGVLFNGYFTLYGPFLFVGSLLYLAEHKKANLKLIAITIIGIFTLYFIFYAKIWPVHKESNFAIYGLLLFMSAWYFRAFFVGGLFVRLLSNLTYSVYLFHNWLWPYLYTLVTKVGFTVISYNTQVFLVLLSFCYVVHITVEHYGIKMGRYALAKYRHISFAI